ncbi:MULTISPECIES: hypothetical protein [Methylomicrobium]|nr:MULTISPECIES: hypothetical protein [Methylomicrobium]
MVWPPQALSPIAIADESHIRIINRFILREKNGEKFAGERNKTTA